MTPHPSLEALIAAEDDPRLGEVDAHLAGCPECARERAALRLRRSALKSLPLLTRPRQAPAVVADAAASAPTPAVGARARLSAEDTWRALEATFRRSARRRRAVRVGLGVTAALLAAAVLWPAVRPAPVAKPDAVPLAALIEQSQELEAELTSISDPLVVDVEDADARAEVEDEIAWVDQCLSELDPSAPEDERAALWKTRIGLLESLLKLRRSPPVLVRL